MDEWNFTLPDSPSQRSAKRKRSASTEDHQSYLWADQYEPKSMADVCVRGDKVRELQGAIESSAIGSRQGHYKLLLLSGQSGIGKSTLVRLLCKSMNYDILEWINPSNDYDPTDSHTHTMTLFSRFLTSSILRGSQRQIIFVDDMPDITTDDIKRQLHSILKHIVYSPAKFLLIMVATDAWMESLSYRDYDSKLNRSIDIIPAELNTDLRVKHIKFNPVNKTNMNKVLKNILSQEHANVPKDRLDDIIEKSDGDIRAAINTLQFDTIHSRKARKVPSKKKSGDKPPFDDKTGPLTLFHAVGKVLYAKRNPNGTYESKPEHILAKCPVDNDTFITYLHQNYSEFFDDMESCTTLLNYLSDADTIRSQHDWQDTSASIYRGLVSVNGIMINPPRERTTYRQQFFDKPRFYEAQLATQQQKLENYRKDFMASVQSRMADYESQEQMEYQDDPIQDFSEDEFDDIYGDDDDELAAFMDY
ncbi:Rad17 cell cycle checkpoint protein-domain-containing protein [Mucor lusitanicus]|uniref:Checkpoint protein RAD24-like helical bundle domain-containing protein n=2 Tax=Mucor circinelloides f. lusitanicus TaxID=29924 RepID=A0A168Q2D8_MUCCL|nr:Rad17 cell cycle checkpoint protein-domain-containing protein [Mucor lusitanicus]OAD08591.1 hypothetical protein MUCCIDRAFT_105558 [Mucor lusitanicus CBS 277.49]